MNDYIHDTVGRFIVLSGGGNRLTATCPFHNEDSPSFVVDQSKKTYHCFGCDEHGHVEGFEDALIASRKQKMSARNA